MAKTSAVRDARITRKAEEEISVATKWQLMRRRFRKHKVAVVSGIVVILFYLAALGADFLAYADPHVS